MNLGVALLGAIFLFAISASDWRRSVKIALILVVVEGAIRKWIFPQAADLLFFLKDIVLLGAYARYFSFDQISRHTTGFSGLKTLLRTAAVIIGIQILNLRLGSAAVGLFGFKSYLWYVPLCFMLRDLFRSAAELQTFLKWYLLLAIPVCLLGVLQFYSPHDSPINCYVGTSETSDVAAISIGDLHRARITGTFSYITGHATYLFTSIALLFPLLTSQPKKIWLILSLGALMLAIGNVFMTGSRGALLSGALFFICFLLINQINKGREERSAFITVILTGAICVVASLYWFDEAVDTFLFRAANADSTTERISSGYSDPIVFLSDAGIVGYGAGATHPGGVSIRKRFELSDPQLAPPPAEVETGRVMLDLGLAGFAVWYALRLYLIWALWRTYKQIKTTFLRNLALSAFLVHTIQLPSQLVTNATFGVYFWFLAGFIFLLPRLDSFMAHGAHRNKTYTTLRNLPKTGRIIPDFGLRRSVHLNSDNTVK